MDNQNGWEAQLMVEQTFKFKDQLFNPDSGLYIVDIFLDMIIGGLVGFLIRIPLLFYHMYFDISRQNRLLTLVYTPSLTILLFLRNIAEFFIGIVGLGLFGILFLIMAFGTVMNDLLSN